MSRCLIETFIFMNMGTRRVADTERESLTAESVADVVSKYVGGTTGIGYEWKWDDSTDLLIIWLASYFKDTKVKYHFWLSDFKTISEFESALKKRVDLLHSFQAIGLGADALCDYDYVLSVLDRYDGDIKSVSVDDFVIWATLRDSEAPGVIEVMAEGRDSYGSNYDLFKTIEDEFGADALYKFAGVTRILVRVYHDKERSMFDDYWVDSPDHKTVRQFIHAAVEANDESSLEDVREVFGQFVSRISNLQRSMDERG